MYAGVGIGYGVDLFNLNSAVKEDENGADG
jgi:hypothetical protein